MPENDTQMAGLAAVANNGRTTRKLGGVTGRGFIPGQSGNPNGRPKVAETVQRTCRAFFETGDGWEIVDRLAHSPDPRVAWPVIQDMLGYAYGKPTQPLANPDGTPIGMETRVLVLTQEYSLDDLRTLLAEVRARRLAAPPAPGGPPGPQDGETGGLPCLP